MIYPKMGGARSYNVTVPKLSGGINTSESPHLIDDNQLTDSLNMWWKDGALRARDGLWTDNLQNLIPSDIDLYAGGLDSDGTVDSEVEDAVTTDYITLPDVSGVVFFTYLSGGADLTIAFYNDEDEFIELHADTNIVTASVPATAKSARLSIKYEDTTTENFFNYIPYLIEGANRDIEDETKTMQSLEYPNLGTTPIITYQTADNKTLITLCTASETAYIRYYNYLIMDTNGYLDRLEWFQMSIGFGGTPEYTKEMVATVNSSSDSSLSEYGLILFSSPYVYGLNGENEMTELSSEIHIPTISINGVPSATTDGKTSGDVNEEKNMLTPKFKVTFTTDGVGNYYFLPLKGLDNSEVIITRIDASGTSYTWTIEAGQNSTTGLAYNAHVNRLGGYVWFTNANGDVHPMTAGGTRNNLTITASKTVDGSFAKICGMTFNTWYGGDASGLHGGTRLFVSGNPEYPNLVHWSDVNNPLYFPEGNYKYIGGESQKVTAFGKQSDMLVIFKERETYRLGFQSAEVTTQAVEAGTAVTNDYVFTVSPINAYIGCDVPNTIQLCANRLVWANSNGKVYTLVSANQYNEQTIREVSQNIESKLKEHDISELQSASAADYDGHYYLLIGNTVYLMDYRSNSFTYYGSYTNDEKSQRSMKWFKWNVAIGGVTWQRIIGEGTQPVLCGSRESEDDITLINYVFSPTAGHNDYTPSGQAMPVPCMFSTKTFDFGNPSTMKNINEMYLGVGRESTQPAISISYLTDRGQAVDAYTLYPLKQPADSGTSEHIDIRRITPRLSRILRFGIKVESNKAMSVDSMEIRYSPYGGVK